MDRDPKGNDAPADEESTVRDGNLIIDESINRRDSLVEYEGTTEGASGTRPATGEGTVSETRVVETATESGVVGGAMQAGATLLGGVAQPDEASVTIRSEEETTVGANTRASDPLSMSSDNSASGLMGSGTIEDGPITQVREGMRVLDAQGDEIGKVDSVRMGDPAAASAPGEEMATGGDVVDDAVPAVGATGGSGAAGSPGGAGAAGALTGVGDSLFGGGPDLPESLREDLLRVGFIRIDGKGWIDTDRFARADQIADVSGDTVRLSVGKDALSED